MKEQRERDMRLNLKELDREQLTITCINLQDVIDGHVSEKGGLTSSINSLNKQNEMLRQENDRLEGEVGGNAGASVAELEDARAKILRLEERNEKLQLLNEALQERLITPQTPTESAPQSS